MLFSRFIKAEVLVIAVYFVKVRDGAELKLSRHRQKSISKSNFHADRNERLKQQYGVDDLVLFIS